MSATRPKPAAAAAFDSSRWGRYRAGGEDMQRQRARLRRLHDREVLAEVTGAPQFRPQPVEGDVQLSHRQALAGGGGQGDEPDAVAPAARTGDAVLDHQAGGLLLLAAAVDARPRSAGQEHRPVARQADDVERVGVRAPPRDDAQIVE
jgi:hypothetical protein